MTDANPPPAIPTRTRREGCSVCGQAMVSLERLPDGTVVCFGWRCRQAVEARKELA